MKSSSILLLLMMAAIPVTGLAQQATDSVSAAKSPVQGESLAVKTAKPAGVPATTAMTAQGYDPIGDEEEMDAEDGFDYQEWLLMWPELDEGREFDPLDPREEGQAADSREERAE